jgi:hypothetical protein
MKSGGIELLLWTQISSLTKMIRSCECFPHASKTQTLTYKWVNSVAIKKNARILNILPNKFILAKTKNRAVFPICFPLISWCI